MEEKEIKFGDKFKDIPKGLDEFCTNLYERKIEIEIILFKYKNNFENYFPSTKEILQIELEAIDAYLNVINANSCALAECCEQEKQRNSGSKNPLDN